MKTTETRSDRRFPPLPRGLRVAVGVALALGAAACTTPQKRVEQGMQLEQRGRPAEAAERYIAALRRDPSLADARTRLQEAGDRAVADWLAEAASADAGAAADAFLRADALRRDASSVGVQLAAPADYDRRRRAALDRAIDQAIAESERSAAGGDFSGSVRWLERARERWQPSPEQRAELDDARFEATLSWAEGEMRGGRFRAAYERAEQAALVYGRDSQRAARARELQTVALERGTVRAAVLPVGATANARRDVHEDFLPELNDALEERYWLRPPLFVDVLDPQRVAREARRQGYTRQTPTTREVAILGGGLGVELVAVAELDSVRRAESDVRTERRAARTREGADTAYTVRQGRQEVWGRVTYALVDVASRRVIDQGSTSASASARFRRGVYAGDYRTLNLTREQRDLFDSRAGDDAERQLVRELAAALSERLGREVYDVLLRHVD